MDNLLTHDFSSALAPSGLLQFRRLRIIDRASSLRSAYLDSVAKDPMTHAWFLSREDLLKYFEPDGRWYLKPEAYWSLYEKNKQAPWAEELAWAAAQLTIPLRS